MQKLNPTNSGVDIQGFVLPHPLTGRNNAKLNSVDVNILIGGRKMSISILVQAAAAKPLSRENIERACEEEKMQLSQLYDAFARDVAEKYLSGEYGWRFCDDAMNSLFTYAHPVSLSGLPAFAFDVYCAFDEGEYRPEGEALSKRLITDALRKNEPIQPPQTTTGSSAPGRV